jgi:hypothetical protein
LLTKTRRAQISATTTTLLENKRITFQNPVSALTRLEEVLSVLDDDTPVALMTEPDRRANSLLVWEPDQEGPVAIAPHGSRGDRVSGTFLVMLPGQQDDRGQFYEDGFVMWLTSPSWLTVRDALLSGKPTHIAATRSGYSLDLAWNAD